MPELSSSLDSDSSVGSDGEPSSLPQNARPESQYANSCQSRSRGREKHVTPVDLEKIVVSIKATQELVAKPITLPMISPSIEPQESMPTSTTQDFSKLHLESSYAIEQSSDTTTPAPPVDHSSSVQLQSSASTLESNNEKASESGSSDASSHTEMSGHSIIRGFVAGGAPSSYRSQTNLAAQPTPILKNSPRPTASKSRKKGAMFTIGTSSGEEESSLEHRFKSNISESLKRPSSHYHGSSSKKQTSFKEEVAIGRAAEHSPVFESDDEDEDAVSESAIDDDDDDSSDWEDSEDMSAQSSVNEKDLFQRVDSRPNLTSRRSLLTTLMHEPDRAKALANAASRSTPALRRSRNTTPNGPSVATSPVEGEQIEIPNHDEARGRPIIMTTSNTHQHSRPHSPRTTRRHMLSTELTESLRKNLLWERQHRSTGNLAALNRRHTSNDVKNLKQHPEPGPVLSHQAGARTFTNDYFHQGLQEYHAKGW